MGGGRSRGRRTGTPRPSASPGASLSARLSSRQESARRDSPRVLARGRRGSIPRKCRWRRSARRRRRWRRVWGKGRRTADAGPAGGSARRRAARRKRRALVPGPYPATPRWPEAEVLNGASSGVPVIAAARARGESRPCGPGFIVGLEKPKYVVGLFTERASRAMCSGLIGPVTLGRTGCCEQPSQIHRGCRIHLAPAQVLTTSFVVSPSGSVAAWDHRNTTSKTEKKPKTYYRTLYTPARQRCSQHTTHGCTLQFTERDRLMHHLHRSVLAVPFLYGHNQVQGNGVRTSHQQPKIIMQDQQC
mgnify:CR=1 FL=1